MKTPQEYAEELVEKYLPVTQFFNEDSREYEDCISIAKQACLIDVQNTIDANPTKYQVNEAMVQTAHTTHIVVSNVEYYQEVKTHLETL